jgi:hypothetical protein
LITIRSRKQTYEQYFISASIIHVQRNAAEKVVLSASSVLAWDKDGGDVATTLLDQATKKLDTDPKTCGLDYSNNMLSIRVRGGDEALMPYKVTFKMETTDGNRYEADMRVGVNEI